MIETDRTALVRLGWSSSFEEALAPYADEGCVPARVAVQHRGAYDVYLGHVPGPGPWTGPVLPWPAETPAEVSARLRREASAPRDFPAVGDWVAARPAQGAGRAAIEAVLPRRTAFSRNAASDQHRLAEEQIVAANVDVVFLVAGLPGDLNLRRLERYLVLAWESGAEPAIVLTKADLCAEPSGLAAEVESVALGVPVHVVSNVTGEGIDELEAYFAGHRTVAALGSSGVGKSSLINRLAGRELAEVGALRRDGKGRHTTARRELLPLPAGGFFLDTPGMRELQLWQADSGIGETFDDIASLARRCRFRDCGHDGEPGCAVLEALARGALDLGRLDGYRKLGRELEHLRRKLDRRAAAEERKRIRRRARARRRPGG